jgi:peptidoglycan hydrolase CwlO-like protein
MRIGSTHIESGTTRRRGVLTLALLVLASLCALFAFAGGAPAETLQQKFDQKQGQLDHVRAKQRDVSATIAEQNQQVNALIGQVSAAQAAAAAIEHKLAVKQHELDLARAKLARQQHHLEVVRGRLHRAMGVLRKELVSVYEAGNPDTLDVVLNSTSWSDMVAQSEYLKAYQQRFNGIVDRVRTLRDQTRNAVHRLRDTRDRLQKARDEIAVQKTAADRKRNELQQRHGELIAARRDRQQQLNALVGRGSALQSNLSAISDQMFTGSSGGPTPSAPAPLAPGDQAQLLSNGDAAAPASAPAAVKNAIAAANQIDETTYVWGGGHGSFTSSGYDCSGAVSFALNGGGLLSSPLDSTGLETWGVAGAGRWITVYANAGHAWMVIAGLRFDTVGGPGPRWHTDLESTSGFIARHPDGY